MIVQRRRSRRGVLVSAGATVALPFLESLAPRTASAATQAKRLLFYYVPCGIHMAGWTPATTGPAYALTPILKPLETLRADVSVITGLANLPARPDGPGDHASGTGAFLTCAHPKKTEGSDIQNGVSVDQIAAGALAKATKFPSLQLGIDGGSSAGGCDSGYSCAYARSISWAGPATPLPKIINPQTVFDQLFEGLDATVSPAERDRRRRYKTSVLDFALADATALRTKLGVTDRRKVDEFMGGVREIERQVADKTMMSGCQIPARPSATLAYQEHVRLMSDIMVLAFQCDLVRVATFMIGNAGSNRTYPFIGVPGAHHQLSHHQMAPANLAALQTIGTWEVEQFAYLLGKMKAVTEGTGTLLENSAVFFSSEIEDGDAHRHTNLPVLLAGKGGGALHPGSHIIKKDQPIANLFLAMLGSVGVNMPAFGNSTGPLADL